MKKLFSGKHRRNHSCEGAFAGGSGTNLDIASELQAPETSSGARHRGPSHLQPAHLANTEHTSPPGRHSLHLQHPQLQQHQQQQQYSHYLPAGVHPMMLQQHQHSHYPPGVLAPVNLNDPAAIEDANVEEAKRASLQVFQEQLCREHEENMLIMEKEQKRVKAQRAAQEAKLAAYRLSHKYYESGSLEYSEPLVDGFYMLYGDFPELEEVVDANTKFPSLDELRRVPLYEGDVREVVFVDADQDSGLVAIQEKASVATCEAAVRANSDVERAFRRITSLAQVVVDVLGGSYDSEEMLQQMWLAASSKEKTRSKCIVIHLAHLTAGTCRHRALLFKVLADSLNLMCQLQRSRHSETEDERVVNVVQIDKKDYVVDLVYQPGCLEPLNKFVAQNPTFSHLRSGCQASTRYRAPVPPLPGPHPPSSLPYPHPLQPPSRPSSSTSGSTVPTSTQPVPASATTAGTDPSKATRTQSATLGAAVVGAALASPAGAGAAAQPGSAAQSRPSSGTPAPVTPSPSHPSTPGPPAAAVAAASPDSVGVAGVQDPSQSQPLPQQQQQQYIAYMQQQQEQQGQHHHRQGRAESWDELAASRAMNQIATDLISLDEDDAGGAERGTGSGAQGTGWVTFGSNSFGRGQHLGAMLAAAQNRQGPEEPQQQQQQQQQQQEDQVYSHQAKQMHDSHGYQPHMQGGSPSALQGSSGVASSSGGASDSPFANYLAMMSTGVQDGLSQPSNTCSPRAQNSVGLQSQSHRDSMEGSPMHMAHDPGGQGSTPKLPQQSSSTSSQDARGSGSQVPLSAAGLAQASLQRPNSHAAASASAAYLYPHHHAHHQSLADLGLSALSLGTESGLRPGSLPQQRHQLLGAGGSGLGGSISGSSQSAGADLHARPRSNSWNQQQQQQQTPVTPPSPPAYMIGSSAAAGSLTPAPQQQPSPSQSAQLLPPHPSPPAGSGLSTPPPAMPPPLSRRAPAIAAGSSAAHHNKRGDEVFADLSPFPVRPPPPVPRLANSTSMDRLNTARAHPSGTTSPGSSSSSQQQQRQQLQQMNGPLGSNLQPSGVAGASAGAALPGRAGSNSSSSGNLQGLAGEQADSLDSLQQQQQQQPPIPGLSQASAQQGACVSSVPLASPGAVWSHYGAEGVQATASTAAAAAAAAAAANSQALGGGNVNRLSTYAPSSVAPISGQLWTSRYPHIATESGTGLQAQASQAQSQSARPCSTALPLPIHSQSLLVGHPMLLGTSLPPASFLQPLPLVTPPSQPPLSPSPFVLPTSSQPQLPPLYNPSTQLNARPFLQSAPAGLTNNSTNTLPPIQYTPPHSAQPGAGGAGLGPPLRTAPLISPDSADAQSANLAEQPTANGGVGGGGGGAPGAGAHASQGSKRLTAEPSLQMSGYTWEIDPEDLDYGSGQRLGVGSYGEVYKGMWQGTEVAIKRFLDQNLSDAIRKDFKHEVQLMSRLRHPNIVLFLGAVIQPTQLAIVSEFVPRGSLFRLLHRSRAHIEPKRLLLMAMDIARGMNYLHSCRPMVVHRDLKSPNLLVDRDWTIKITDFGLSRVANATVSQTPRSCAGTPEWMAPEILRNEQVDEKSDVFSFGVILWELVTRKEPWEGLNAMQVVGAVGFNKKRLLIPDDLAPELTQLIQACWEEQPSLRPSFKSILGALASMEPRGLVPSSSCIEAYAREHQMR